VSRLGRSCVKVCSTSLVRVLIADKISWVLGSQGFLKSFSTHYQSNVILVCFLNKEGNPQGKVPMSERSRVFCIAAMKRSTLLREPMSLMTLQQSETRNQNGPSIQDIDEFRLIWKYS